MRYLTSADKPVAEQFSYWREVICQVCTPLAAEREPAHRDGITGWARSSALRSTHCAEVCSRTQSLIHGPAELRRTMTDDVFVNLQLRGHCLAGQGKRTCHIGPGGFAMFDTTNEYRLNFQGDERGEWQVISFRVPRSRLVPLLADPDGFTAVTHDATAGGIAGVVASTMTAIWRTIESLDHRAAEAAETAFLSVLAAAAGGTGELRETRRETVDASLRASVNRYLAANLQRCDLTAAHVARCFGISVRKLHGLYQHTEHTFAQTVMALRLDACAQDLRAGAGQRTLTDIATRWGFSDLSHLNRVFRARHGCLPSEFRAVALAARMPTPTPPVAGHRGVAPAE
ncbi:MAG TPA: helix-turn-helix domain-containing protein [Sporichthyaceae bacterium]|nr:helix-turn-helix domain-containing protein [Sporichthyaceae bacterium]